MSLTRLFKLSLALVSAFVIAPQISNAQYTVVHRFGDGSQSLDGAYPGNTLTVTPNGIFGATTDEFSTELPGFIHHPTVFSLLTNGSVLIVYDFLHSLLVPNCPLLYYKNAFFGTTDRGPASSPGGVLFRLRESPLQGVWHSVDLHTFASNGSDNPSFANTPVILGSNGDLYGTTYSGGPAGQGTIYRLNPSSHLLKVLYNFDGTIGNPSSLMLAKDGNYYGTSGGTVISNGSPIPVGAIFKMTPAGTVTVLYTLAHAIHDPLIQANDGNFYGTVSDTVIKMTPEYVVSVLFTFPEGNGGHGIVQGPTGNLYGTTSNGGTANNGTIYELTTDGASYQVLHNFGDGSVSNDGLNPASTLVVGSDNNLYGTTPFGGGAADAGTIFEISP